MESFATQSAASSVQYYSNRIFYFNIQIKNKIILFEYDRAEEATDWIAKAFRKFADINCFQ